MRKSLRITRKVIPYAPLLLLLTLSVALTNVSAAISPNSPAEAVYIVPDQVIYSSAEYCTYNNTDFTVTVIFQNFTGVAGFQIKISYNATLLSYVKDAGYNFDTGTPMTPTQVAPAANQRVDTDASTAGSVQVATVWKSGVPTYSYSGNATAAIITFKIIYCPPQFIGVDNTVSCALDNDATQTKCVDDFGDDIFFAYVGDGYYEYTTLGSTPTPPVANFTWSPASPGIGETVTFDASDSTPDGGTIVSYDWDFGDENITTVGIPVITHVYTSYGTGTYIVTLNVTDSEDKWDTESKSVTLQLPGTPVADFTWSPETPIVNETVTFDASDSTPDGGTIVSYDWDFGDDTTGTGMIVDHTYRACAKYPGAYTINLTIRDSEGATASVEKQVTVVFRTDVSIYPATAVVHQVGDNVTVQIRFTNVTGVAGFQFQIDYNATVLEYVQGWYLFDLDPAHPLSPTQMAPALADRVETDVSASGSVKLAVVWKAGVLEYTYSGTSAAANVTFRGLMIGNSTLSLVQIRTYPVDYNGNEMYPATLEDGFVTVVPEFSVAMILTLLITATLAAAFLAKMTQSKRQRS